MYDGNWFKNIKKIRVRTQYDPKVSGGIEDLAVVELSEEIEPKYVKPACFFYVWGHYNFSDPLLVSFKSWLCF